MFIMWCDKDENKQKEARIGPYLKSKDYPMHETCEARGRLWNVGSVVASYLSDQQFKSSKWYFVFMGTFAQ